MTEFIARLQRRAEGSRPPIEPHFPGRPVDPRFSPISSFAPPADEPAGDPFAAVLADAVPSRAPLTAPLTPIDEAPGPSVIVERHTERIVELPPSPAQGAHVAPPAPRPAAPAHRGPEPSIRPQARTLNPVSAPNHAAISATPPAREGHVLEDISSERVVSSQPLLVRRIDAPPHDIVRSLLEDTSRRLPEAPISSRPAPAAAVVGVEPRSSQPARLDPIPRDPPPPTDVTLEPAPRVVIGNLHIEVVRAAPAPAPRREQVRPAPARAATPTPAAPTRTRRRTVFGLGQL